VNDTKQQFFDYIESVRHKPFVWGSHDCLTFTNNACRILTGKGYADDWVGSYSDARSAFRWYKGLLKDYGFENIVDATDGRLSRIKSIAPPFGSLVARPHITASNVTDVAFGVAVSKKVAFVDEQSLVFLTATQDDIFWSLK
jgi:hypothetical protein